MGYSLLNDLVSRRSCNGAAEEFNVSRLAFCRAGDIFLPILLVLLKKCLLLQCETKK